MAESDVFSWAQNFPGSRWLQNTRSGASSAGVYRRASSHCLGARIVLELALSWSSHCLVGSQASIACRDQVTWFWGDRIFPGPRGGRKTRDFWRTEFSQVLAGGRKARDFWRTEFPRSRGLKSRENHVILCEQNFPPSRLVCARVRTT